MDEVWKDIPGFENLYQISNYGKVKSLSRKCPSPYGFYFTKEKILKSSKNQKGYLTIKLNNKKTNYKHSFPIHRLVAIAFIPNPDNKPQVNHIDCNKTNNFVSNLEWCTNGENQLHAYKHGLNHHSKNAGRKKRKVAQIDIKTNKVIKIFDSIADATKTLCKNSKTRNITMCCKKQYGRKTCFGYKWEYVND